MATDPVANIDPFAGLAGTTPTTGANSPPAVNNPPDPQVPAPPAPTDLTAFASTNTTLSVAQSSDPNAVQAQNLANDLSGNGVSALVEYAPTPVSTTTDPLAGEAGSDQAGPPVSLSNYYDSPNAVGPPVSLSDYYSSPDAVGPPASLANAGSQSNVEGLVTQANQQQTMSSQSGFQASSTDWRVRISLAKGAGYLYNDPNPGILQPLKSTSGVIFPYTPRIETSYKAMYQQFEPTHSNYKGYFYQGSSVEPINITGHFTAQNSNDANYVLAVIHFFRSVTKMFYGQDAQRGSPPPLVYLSGFGQYQFNGHPCVVSSFTYSLPDDVDYIRAGVANNLGLNATTISNVLNSAVASGAIGGYARLAAAFTTPGALPSTPFGSLATPNLASGAPTYVPTKMDITVTLLPVVSRQSVSKQFSVKNYANGNLLRGGFW